MRKRVLTFLMVLLIVAVGVPTAQGTLLRLSDYASDGGSPPPAAEDLDATFDFSVIGSTLTLAVTNLTPETVDDPALNMNEIYFNAKSNITGLVLTSVINSQLNKWSFEFIQGGGLDGVGNPHQVNGFGKFDVYIVDGVGNQPHVINPGETVSFIMNIIGTGPFYDTDFIELSTQVDSHIISSAAAKFYDGVPGISAYGATNVVPEPATLTLLGLGGVLMLRRRRK